MALSKWYALSCSVVWQRTVLTCSGMWRTNRLKKVSLMSLLAILPELD
jgi:hypothetical protein